MPGVSRKGDKSTGHGSFPPTALQLDTATTVRVNGKECAKVGSKYLKHSSGTTTHDPNARSISAGSSTVRVEGSPIARLGDSVACGDKIGQASGNVYAGG